MLPKQKPKERERGLVKSSTILNGRGMIGVGLHVVLEVTGEAFAAFKPCVGKYAMEGPAEASCNGGVMSAVGAPSSPLQGS